MTTSPNPLRLRATVLAVGAVLMLMKIDAVIELALRLLSGRQKRHIKHGWRRKSESLNSGNVLDLSFQISHPQDKDTWDPRRPAFATVHPDQ